MKVISRWYWALLAFVALMVEQVASALDGTNAVSILEDNVSNASSVSWLLTLGIISALVVLGVFFKIGRKGGIKT